LLYKNIAVRISFFIFSFLRK